MPPDESAVPEWAATALPENLRDLPFLTGADTPEVFKQRVQDASQWMGNSLRMPGPDAGADDIKAFYGKVMEKVPGLMPVPNAEDADGVAAIMGKLGRPDNADKYSAPEGTALEGEALGQLKSLAFKAGLTQAQFSEYAANVSAATKAQIDQQTVAHETGMAELRGEWGASFEQNVGQIAALLKTNTTTPPYIIEQLEKGNLPPDQVRWLHSIASTVSNEDGEFHKQENTGLNTGLMNPAEASARCNELTKRIMDTGPNRPSKEEAALLQQKALAYEYMAAGQRPPAELMRFITN